MAEIQDDDLEDLYEHAPCGYITTLLDGTIIKVNTTFLEWTGYNKADLLKRKRFQDLLPVTGKIYFDTHYSPLLLMQGYIKELALEILDATSTRIPVLANTTLKRDSEGKPSLIRIILLEAVSRRTYEQELLLSRQQAKAAEEKIRQLNEMLEQLVDIRTTERDRLWQISQDILCIVSSRGKLLNANPAFSQVLGWSSAEIEKISFVEFLMPEAVDDFTHVIGELSSGRSMEGILLNHLHQDKSERWISWNIANEDDMLYMVGRDVTEERIQAQALRSSEAALYQAKKMEAVGQLAAGIAHDFNNMLAAVMGNLDLMKEYLQAERTDDLQTCIQGAESAVDRAATTVKHLLALSKKQNLTPRPADVNESIRNMYDLINSAVGSRVEVCLDLSDDIPKTLCDATQLENAILNIVINARDAMPDKGKLSFTTSTVLLKPWEAKAYGLEETDTGYVSIAISDTGKGMPTEVLERVFEPFFSTKLAAQGTGLGLSMVYGFIQQSGGHIHITSQVDLGTTVQIFLPALN